MATISYSVGEIRQLIKEKSGEFKAVKGPNVDAENKRQGEKFYKDTENACKDYDGGLQKQTKMELPEKTDGNATTLDAAVGIPANKEYQDKVEAQSKGYTSDLEAKNGNERGGAEMDDDGRILKQFTDARNKREDAKKQIQKAGLIASKMPSEIFDKNHLVKESAPKPRKLLFKRTKFINESQVLDRIPEEYKNDGQRIKMIDSVGNEYIVECVKSERSGCIETQIVSHKNEKLMNEQVNRIHELMGYTHEEANGAASNQDRINESASFKDLMDLARGKKNC